MSACSKAYSNHDLSWGFALHEWKVLHKGKPADYPGGRPRLTLQRM